MACHAYCQVRLQSSVLRDEAYGSRACASLISARTYAPTGWSPSATW
jgi:hypothetical protein